MSINTKEQLIAAIEQWKKVVDSPLLYSKGTRDSAERCIKSLLYELETGIAVCSCCFKPFSGEAKFNH